MPKKKIEEIVRKSKGTKPGYRTRVAARPAAAAGAKKPAASPKSVTAADLSQFPTAFENKAGRYELIRVDGEQAYYSFTNHLDKTVDAAMPVLMWKKMQERAVAAFKETA
ncbi:MAG TPA: hypothetical protein VGL72_18065 [Bryobacteraceae bacterium]|jgi:hypothetical protein